MVEVLTPVIPAGVKRDKPTDSCKQERREVLPFNQTEMALFYQGLSMILASNLYKAPQSRKYIDRLRGRLLGALPGRSNRVLNRPR